MKVFLGGTCAGWKWRDELQPLLKCDYYNPIVKNWSETDRLREVYERETSDFVLYGITNGIKGVYSIAELVDDANKRPEKTIFVNLYKAWSRSSESKQMAHSLKAVENLVKEHGVKVFSGENALQDAADFLNRKISEQFRGAVITEDYEKMRCIIDGLIEKYSDGISYHLMWKNSGNMMIEFKNGSYIKWLKPSCESRNFKYHKLWCDKSIANTKFFNETILPCYLGKYEDIIWI